MYSSIIKEDQKDQDACNSTTYSDFEFKIIATKEKSQALNLEGKSDWIKIKFEVEKQATQNKIHLIYCFKKQKQLA